MVIISLNWFEIPIKRISVVLLLNLLLLLCSARNTSKPSAGARRWQVKQVLAFSSLFFVSIHSILFRQIQFESITRLFLSKKGSANSVLLLAILYPKMLTKIFSNYISLFSLFWPFAFVCVFLKFSLLEGSVFIQN